MAKTPARKKSTTTGNKKNVKTAIVEDKALADKVSEERVLAKELLAEDGHSKIGIMTLNSAKTMNAVDLEMVNLIDEILVRWQDDENIVAMVMTGAGDKAFCAGGDIRQLYDSMQAEGEAHLKYADDFFTGEYGKNYRVHRFGKPLIAWGHGFVMGGGLGLYIGASHKVGTETLKLAWPEIRIGLFPDVAGSYYLSRLEYPLGHWMALTGSQMNAVDCKEAGLINYCIENNGFDGLISQLKQQPWQNNKAMNNQFVRELLRSMEKNTQVEFPKSNLVESRQVIDDLFSKALDSVKSTPKSVLNKGISYTDRIEENRLLLASISQVMSEIVSENTWLKQGIENFKAGCPATAHLIMQQLMRGKDMTLKEVVQWELIMALQSVRHPDFAEGIRAMVVDKDFKPRWQHNSVETVPNDWVEALMKPLWANNEHPFRAL